MTVKIAGSSFGRDEAHRNGLAPLERELIAKVKTHSGYAVIWYDVKEIKTLSDSDEETAVVRILGVEPVDGAHAEDVQHIYTVRYDNRTGTNPAFQPGDDLDIERPQSGAELLRHGSGVHLGGNSTDDLDDPDDWSPADDLDDPDDK